ncbi:NADP-dependent oxidoreductase [Azoarcus sp. KH32C]|uniref:NADP-dependent oxidoreductase n=1 Tax=Azoarcus sp. KH32C TaxID=748247 RepID=UPI00023863E9|nr:NADP-dependent oxidoreductase [Azoarcus sp. KH32C]BAL24644.1 alcohol dehydrogenase containing zinc-binding domain [Azoarcus sp. KH32C]
MTASANRQWLLRRRPQGPVGRVDLELARSRIPTPADGELLVRIKLLCMDPTIRNFMDADPGYKAPVAVGGVIRGMVVGEVVESRDPARSVGELVWGFGEWSDYVAGPAAQFFALPTHFGHPLPTYTHALGTIGLTAHYGLHDVARVRPGDTVLVSGAAGAVGSLVGQMARIAGASRVIGIAGGSDKCRRATERYGYDVCIDYKGDTALDAALGEAFPNGIDVVFENVGGAILEAALNHLRKNARVALCGMIARYGATEPVPGPRNLWNLVVNTARIQGFLVSDILRDAARVDTALTEIDSWIRTGRLRYDLDVRTGFENVPDIFNCLFTGAHTGRLVVQIDQDRAS